MVLKRFVLIINNLVKTGLLDPKPGFYKGKRDTSALKIAFFACNSEFMKLMRECDEYGRNSFKRYEDAVELRKK